jgi:DNA-binding NtrC family response regulator
MKKHVLVVDDEEGMRSFLAEALCLSGYMVTVANDAPEAFALLASDIPLPEPVDLLLTDYNLPKLTGLDLVEMLKHRGIDLPCLLMSGNPDEELATKALARGCTGFLKKPFRLAALVKNITQALKDQPEPVVSIE